MEVTKPRLLDLFCGAGGCSMGYHRAGFEVVGVDINPQPRYPFTFIHADALIVLAKLSHRFDVIHASPPCQAYTTMRHLGKRAGENAPDLVATTRDMLKTSNRLYVIENVVGSPLQKPTVICGSFFGLGVRRHRLFETSFRLATIPWCRHSKSPRPIAVYGDHPQGASLRINRANSLSQGREAMGIDWMNWRELTQAIPPAYTEYIGNQLIRILH